LRDRIALVTGSTSGVGAEIAVRFAEEGAQVVLTGWATERGRDVVEDIRASGGKAIFVTSDPRSGPSVHDLVTRVIAGYGRIDVLVNVVERAAEREPVHPMFWCCRYVIPRMAVAGGGSVINLSAPPAAPGAVAALARRLAATHRPHRVRVNTIVAGPAEGGQARRVADLAVYLASAESASLTGRELTPDRRPRIGAGVRVGCRSGGPEPAVSAGPGRRPPSRWSR
jgi:NAD(P)-dependent dehydrogenase (short-subunit alcohol dehydrogenase family)